jgi:hypothetical protein
MTNNELRASRALLLALHAQADRSPRLRPRLAAFRTALACVEAVQASLDVPDTVMCDLRPTCYGPPSAVHRTEIMTLLEARL